MCLQATLVSDMAICMQHGPGKAGLATNSGLGQHFCMYRVLKPRPFTSDVYVAALSSTTRPAQIQ